MTTIDVLEGLRANFESSATRDEMVAEGYTRGTKAIRQSAADRAVAWHAAAERVTALIRVLS